VNRARCPTQAYRRRKVRWTRAELEEWECRFDEHAVVYTPIRDMEFGYHLNFRDPDNIALELSAPNDMMLAAQQALAAGQTSRAEIAAFIGEHIDPSVVVH